MGRARSGAWFGAAAVDPDRVTTRIGTRRVGGRGGARKIFSERKAIGEKEGEGTELWLRGSGRVGLGAAWEDMRGMRRLTSTTCTIRSE